MKKPILLLAILSGANLMYTAYNSIKTGERLDRIEDFIMGVKVEVTATMYNPVSSQCDKDPLTTAGMYRIDPKRASQHRWIAVSRNLLKRWGGQFEYGDKVRITGAGHKDGIYTIVDTMNPRYRNRIDFLETKGTRKYKFDNVQLVSM